MRKLEKQLEEVEIQKQVVLQKIDERNKKRKIKCEACEGYHRIDSLIAIQTHNYEEPYGCTGGDNWTQGELQFVCPKTGTINRLLFNNHDVSWDERGKHENDPQEQFSRKYKRLFKEVQDTHEKRHPAHYAVNNYYIDNKRKEFDIVEKRKE